MHEQYRFSQKATNAFVRLVMHYGLAKFCFTTLKNQRANVISPNGNFPPTTSK